MREAARGGSASGGGSRLRIKQRARRGVCVLALSGRLDRESSRVLRERLHALVRSRTRAILLDLTALDHIGTPGIATLVEGQQGLMAYGGTLACFGAGRTVRAMVEILHLDRVLRFFADEETALVAGRLA